MHTTSGDIFTIVSSIAAALLLVCILQRTWAPEARRKHNDVVGPSVNVIGTTYAVLVAFMLSGVWSNFRLAESNAEQESNSLVNVFRIASGLAAEDRDRLHQLARQYAQDMLEREWPAMHDGRDNLGGHRAVSQLWEALNRVEPKTAAQQIALDHAISELSRMTEFRRVRQLQSRSQLPPLLWAVLIVGAMVTVGVSCLYGVDDLKLHIIQVFSLTFLIVLVLVAIGNIDMPFRGSVTVKPVGFQYAIQTFDQEMDSHP